MIFADSSFWIAFGSAPDGRHREARAVFASIGTEPVATSNAVRGETWTFVRRRYGHRAAVTLLDLIERSPRLTVHFVGEALEQEALRWLRRHDERRYSFVDATSFALMRALGIERALAFDGDFSAAGFVELRAR